MSLSTTSFPDRSRVDIFRPSRHTEGTGRRSERDVRDFRSLSPHSGTMRGRNDQDVADVFRASNSSQNAPPRSRNEHEFPGAFGRSNNASPAYLRDTKMMDEREHLERQSLPSIRSAIPELQSTIPRNTEADYMESRNTSNSEYIATSPHPKRQRLSIGRERDFGAEQSTPRGFDPIYRSQSAAISPTNTSLNQWTPMSANESRIGSTRSSPRASIRGLPAIHTSFPHNEVRERSFANGFSPSGQEVLAHQNVIDRPQELPRRPGMPLERSVSYAPSSTEPFPSTAYQQPAMTYGYHQHQPRVQSYSGSSTSPFSHDRTPFWNNHHNAYPGSNASYVVAESGNENKQRKRRGNLPKETTDKLRTWFVSHLSHPYPTEDEKQELMRQTGLQINQISNWFINARRRQLPAMINNARAENDARAAREERMGQGEANSDYDNDKRSEGDSAYDDDFDSSLRNGRYSTKRGSV
ncbi:hypothetical protein HYFRA_00008065 [Hymenoscyphus fraxineus]|uniref:Homeobox domain-containing protein n=1 Tax=Hymenoscyphus fraxineus TaxID=746836 RepID=A0A9N9KSG9_9HELO|nr:hypothetical protein HYFRA_00008065 [Hymenoscyphus fraxineus]